MSRAHRPFLTRRTAPRIAGLEARIMFDAAALAQAIDTHDGVTDAAAVVPRPLVQAASPQSLSPTAQAQWSAALDQANQQLLALAQGGGFAALLRESFSSGSQDPAAFERAVAQLTQAVLSGDFRLQVELRSGSELQGAMAAFTADAPGGGPRIYVNADWLRTGVPADLVKRTLLEEVGHSFDQRLNGASDSRGDEGALFSALASGLTPTDLQRAAMAADADRTTLMIDGRAVQVELSELSVPFSLGFIARQGTNSNQANNLQTFTTLGIEYASFFQDSTTGLFTAQGNDIPGGLRLQFTDGTVVTVTGAINWRHTQGSTLYSFGFIPSLTAPTQTLSLPGGGTYTIDSSSNYGLELIGATYNYVTGTNLSGNAATSGLLDALNSYLGVVRANDPTGPVTVNTLTTTDTTPTLTGSVTFNNVNETLEVQVGGVTYRDGDGHLAVAGNSWTLNITSALATGTYSVTATIVDLATYYTLTDSTASELTITAPDTTAPVVTASQSFNYQENRSAGTVVATVAATDAVGVTGFRFGATGTNTSADGYYTIASNGQVSITAAGVAAGVANNDYEVAPNSFSYTIEAGDAAGNWSSAVSVSLNVTNVDETPTAVNDSVSATEDTVYSGTVAGNDTASGDGGNTWAVATNASHGTVSMNANGSFTYTPAANYNGSDSFTYTITDADGDTSTATVTFTVAAVNDLPVAVDDSLNATEDQVFSGTVAGNDTASGDGGSAWSLATNASHGTVSMNADGSFTYTPDANYNGSDSFTYTITDADGDTSTATVTLTVANSNDAPTAGDPANTDWNATNGRYEVTTPEDTARSGTIETADIDGDTLAFSTDTAPKIGRAHV